MRNELKNIETIERYLLNQMTAEEKTAFEKELAQNPKLQEEVQLQKSLMQGMKNLSLKQKAKKAYRKYHFGKGLKKWGGLGGGIIMVTAAAYFAWNYFTPSDTVGRKITYELPELNENGEKEWADADKYLLYQLFDIDNSKDTVVETQDGIVMAVPAGCFLDANGNPVNGPVQLEVKEAIKSDEILMSGLSTRSGNTQLETGGMFYLNARKDGESLKIDANKGIYTEIPTDEVKPGMQVYEGKRMPDGSIDWIKPAPLEKFLVPVDIHSLNFYPPEYEDSLASMVSLSLSKGDRQSKIYKDSLYYSFARLFGAASTNTLAKKENNNEESIVAPIEEQDYAPEDVKLLRNTKRTYYYPADHYLKTNYYNIQFKIVNGNLTGDVDCSSDKEYIALKRFAIEHGFTLNTYGAASIDEKGNSSNYQMMGANLFKEYQKDTLSGDSTLASFIGINPSKIKTIWTNKFNNTLLATREFEERMEYIHRSCDNTILDLYVNNLDKKLCTIDSMAYNQGGGPTFLEFAARGDGRVQVENPSHIRKLQKYYADKTKAYTESAAKTEKEYWEKDQKARDKAAEERVDHALENGRKQADNFIKEYSLNLKEAWRQLGYDQMAPMPRGTYGLTVTNPGWKNIDRAVLESTLARTTLDYTDPYSGKKAVIKYEEVTVTIAQKENYDAVFVYAIPDQLNSFMRLNEMSNVFTEKLNELMKYEMVCVAYKGEQTFMYYQESMKPRKYEGISLTPVSRDELHKKLKEVNTFGHRQDILDELSFRHKEQKENIRVKKVQNMIEFRERIQKVVFPCARMVPAVDSTMTLTDTTKTVAPQ